MMEYFKLFSQSWDEFKHNLVLFVPVLLGLVLYIGGFVIVIIEIVAFIALFSSTFRAPLVSYPSPLAFFLLVLFSLIDLILIIAIDSYVMSALLGMYKEIVNKRKTTRDKMFVYANKYFKKYFLILIYKILIIAVPFLVLATITYAVYLNSKIGGVLLGIIFIIIIFIYYIAVFFGFYFIGPVIVSKKGSSLELVKISFNYARRNPSHVLATFGITVLVSLVIATIMTFFLITLLALFKGNGEIIMRLLIGIIQIILNLFLTLFIFHCFFAKK